MKKYTIAVGIGQIAVDERYFSFQYKIFVDGELNSEGEYQSNHTWENTKAFKRLLENGYALELAMEQIEPIT